MLYTLPNFAAYFGSSILMLAIAMWVYKLITPYDELALIRKRNKAAAVSYIGTAMGMVIAMGSVIINSTGWVDKVVWCAISLGVQLLVWEAVNYVLGNLQKAIAEDECMAYAIMLGGASVTVGVLQAACLVY
jgi:putative membrane protein